MCIIIIFQKDIEERIEYWNLHRIRRSCHGPVPGIPDVLYSCPELQGAKDHIQSIDPNDIAQCRANCWSRQLRPCENEDIYELCLMIMVDIHVHAPDSCLASLESIYAQLRDVLKTPI